MPLSPSDWHSRYMQQARWTHEIRRFLFNREAPDPVKRILEVGCGTGAILLDLSESISKNLYGIDINTENLAEARHHVPHAHLHLADAHFLPYCSSIFEIIFCHFLLMWVEKPQRVLEEMRRVAKPGGAVMALAEPDYGGRIDYPHPLKQLGQLQIQALQFQGADPMIGRRLAGLFARIGLTDIEYGVLGGFWSDQFAEEDWELEWTVLETDLQGLISDNELKAIKRIDAAAWESGERVLYVPTFYAWGRVP